MVKAEQPLHESYLQLLILLLRVMTADEKKAYQNSSY